MIAALVVIALILLVVIQPTRRFHRIVTGLGAIGLLSWAVMWVAGLLFVHRVSFEANLPKYTGMTAAALQKAAVTGGVVGHGFSWSTAVLPFLMSGISAVALLRFHSPVLTPPLLRKQRRNLLGMTVLRAAFRLCPLVM